MIVALVAGLEKYKVFYFLILPCIIFYNMKGSDRSFVLVMADKNIHQHIGIR